MGRQVANITDNAHSIGKFKATWNAVNQNGSRVASGLYIVQLRTENEVKLKRIVLIR